MLEVLNNRTEKTHENEQFRRIVEIIEKTFDKLGYNGLLMGNPFNESYSRFRADAILYYNNGLILIDFKDYRGIIKLPSNENEFRDCKWHNESLKDRSRLEIKAGARFNNPFRQLVAYRNAFRELVERNKYLDGINPARVCIANIFSGPIEIHNEVPKSLPYYKLIQEADLSNFLYDYASENTINQDIVRVLKTIFPAKKWTNTIEVPKPEPIIEEQRTLIDKDVEKKIVEFIKEENGGVFVLESMNTKDRDTWLRFITNEAINHSIPQIEKWSHSARISKKIQKRSNIETDGVYSIIYGGSDIEGQNEDIDKEEELLEVIPLKSNKDIDEKALIIINEAHLISRSLSQSELLRFGSGRLLEDIIKFLNPSSNHKIVFIGDPFSLTYGKDEESALNLETLTEIYQKEKIKHYRKPIDKSYYEGKERLRTDLADSIENVLFNNLNYHFDDTTLINLQDDNQRVQNLRLWFSEPFKTEPNNAILFYSKKDCLKANKWIKRHCLENGNNLANGDLLIVNNNISIPDENGFQIPRRIVNGMFFTILEIKETNPEPINIRQSRKPIVLSFTKIKVKCLSLIGSPETDIWILDNYFVNDNDLTKEEQIAFRIFINKKINEEKRKQKFQDSLDYNQLIQDRQYNDLYKEEKEAVKALAKNYDLPKEKKVKIETSRNARNLLSNFYKRYSKRIFLEIKDSDPFVNAVFVKYGWAITVHKAIGSNYNEIIIKGHRKENDGITNSSYFRWLYSAATTGKIVNITSPKIINPLMNCVFEDNSTKGFSVKSKELLIYENYKVEPQFKDKVKLLENQNVIGAICEVSKLLKQSGFLLQSVKSFSEYLTKALYSIPQSENQQLILNIDNKGSKNNFAVGNIRIEKLNGADEKIIKKHIKDCLIQKESKNTIKDDNPNFPVDFRAEIYSVWFENCQKDSISLKIIQSHDNQDVFYALSLNNDKLIFRVWYGTSKKNHTKGFISKIEVLEKSSDSFLVKIKDLVYGF